MAHPACVTGDKHPERRESRPAHCLAEDMEGGGGCRKTKRYVRGEWGLKEDDISSKARGGEGLGEDERQKWRSGQEEEERR